MGTGHGFILRVFLVAAAMTASTEAFAEKRVALVIGNSTYQNVAKLPNPVNDATAIAGLFTEAGFDVVDVHTDVVINNLRRVVREFSRQARDADIAVVFYAGHGIEVNGTNYLIPVDAKLDNDIDVEDETISLERVLTMIEPAKRLRLVILDACRDNPFMKTMKRTVAARSISRGLAQVEPATSDTLIAFAAKAGSVAIDGDGINSPFTSALLKHVAIPGLDLRIAFGRIRDEVLKSTSRKQEPFVYGSLGGTTIALVPAPDPVKVDLPPPPITSAEDERRDYEFAAHASTKKAWDAFLARYKTGFYTDLAREERAKLIDPAQARIEPPRLEPPNSGGPVATLPRINAERPPASAPNTTGPPTSANTPSIGSEPAAGRKPAGPSVAALPERASPVAKHNQTSDPTIDPKDIARLLQFHLKRIGCDPGSTDGIWDTGSRSALRSFNRFVGTTLDVKVANLDALNAVRGQAGRVCPVECKRGYRVDGERCIPITCQAGYVLGDDGDCRKRKERPKATAHKGPDSHSPPAGAGARRGGKCFTFDGQRFCE